MTDLPCIMVANALTSPDPQVNIAGSPSIALNDLGGGYVDGIDGSQARLDFEAASVPPGSTVQLVVVAQSETLSGYQCTTTAGTPGLEATLTGFPLVNTERVSDPLTLDPADVAAGAFCFMTFAPADGVSTGHLLRLDKVALRVTSPPPVTGRWKINLSQVPGSPEWQYLSPVRPPDP